MHKIYIELVFLDNFMVNLLVILLASRLTRVRIRWSRFAMAAAAGGVYACVAVVFGGAAVWLPIKALAAIAMCFIGFWTPGEKRFLMCAGAFWAASFLLAGAVYACMISFGEPALIGGAIVVRPPVRYILIGLFVGTVLLSVLSKVRRRTQERENSCVCMRLRLGERQTQIRAFVDTGNLARDPLSGLSVVFLSKSAASELLGRELLMLIAGSKAPVTGRLRIVPYATTAGQGILYGIEIDEAALCGAENSTRVVVCVSKRALSGYSGIVGSNTLDELMKGAKNENAMGTQTGGMGDAEAPAGSGDGLYQRERSTAAAADASGGRDAAPASGGGRQVSEADAH